MSARRAMTLAELLVVVAILAVLASMLIGVINMARAAAVRAACLSNLRQVGMALNAFADDHHERYPTEGNKGESDPNKSLAWFYQLPPYIDQGDVDHPATIFQCPAFHWSGGQVFDDASPKSFKMNAWLDNAGRPHQYARGTARDHEYIVGFFDAVGGETGMGQWGHGTPSAVDASRHNGRVNILYLDGHTLSTAIGDADTDWEQELQWKDKRWK